MILKTFAEDYQFIMRKLGLWKHFDEKHKRVGNRKENEGNGLDKAQVLRQISREQLKQLVALKQSEMDMFGYTFDEETLTFNFTD